MICNVSGHLWVLNAWGATLRPTLRPRQHGRHFADDTFKRIFLNENVLISTKISLKFVPKGPINNIPALVQIMAWRRPGDKPLSEAMMVRLLMHICFARLQWVKALCSDHFIKAPSQWETTLHCNIVSHWLVVYTKWSLFVNHKLPMFVACTRALTLKQLGSVEKTNKEITTAIKLNTKKSHKTVHATRDWQGTVVSHPDPEHSV